MAECDKKIHKHFYFNVLRSIFKGANAVITFEESAISEALNVTTETIAVVDTLRKKRSTFSRYFSWSGPNYDLDYTDEQIHAEGAHCVMAALASVLTLLSEKTFSGLFRAGLWCKNSFDTLKECRLIARKRTVWESEASHETVKLGIQLGFGLFNLVFSMLPNRIVRVFRWVGWPADRMRAFADLKDVSSGKAVWSPIAAMVLLGYNCFVEFYGGFGHPDMELIKRLVNEYGSRYEESAFFWLFDAAVFQMKGQPDEAIKFYLKSAETFTQWVEWQNLCYWLVTWCYCVKFDWKSALHYTEILTKTCPWSPCVFTYQLAAILKMQLDETIDPVEREKLQAKIDSCLLEAPKLKHTIVGRTVYVEKFVTKRCEIYWNERRECDNLPRPHSNASSQFSQQDSGIFNDMNNNNSDEDKKVQSKGESDEILIPKVEIHIPDEPNRNEISDPENPPNYLIVNNTYKENDAFMLPILDLFLFWNIYMTFREDPYHAYCLLDRIEVKLSTLNFEDTFTREKYLYLILMKGIIFKHMGKTDNAVDCLTFVLDNEEYLKFYKHLAPHACLELGILCQETSEFQLAEKYLNKATNDYSHYLNETQVHIRAHSSLCMMRAKMLGSSRRKLSAYSIRSFRGN